MWVIPFEWNGIPKYDRAATHTSHYKPLKAHSLSTQHIYSTSGIWAPAVPSSSSLPYSLDEQLKRLCRLAV